MAEQTTCVCGAKVGAGANFCADCGLRISDNAICPQCGAEVNQANFCPDCGGDLQATRSEPRMRDSIWERGEEDFAISVSSATINQASAGVLEVRHGCKALFFEEGRLVEIAESGRYTTQEDGLLNRLLRKKRKLSAILVDAGDVELTFNIADLQTRDELFVGIGMNIVLRLDDPNSFFVNVMKERQVFKNHELRNMLFDEIRDALQEAVKTYDFNDLNSSQATKNEIASRMEAHLRQTFSRSGLGFGQIKDLDVSQPELDAAAETAAETEIKARKIEAEAKGEKRIGDAEIDRDDTRRGIRRQKISGLKEDVDIKAGERDAELYEIKTWGEKDIDERKLKAEYTGKRQEVYKRVKEIDVDKIKTDEDFRKFRQEVDRDQVLDDSEWKEFEDEILWKKEDRRRDRRFLVRKIELQQEYDTRRLEIENNSDLTLLEKQEQAKRLDFEKEADLSREMKRIEGLVKIDEAKVQAALTRKEIEQLGNKQIEFEKGLKDIELEKKKAEARHDVSKLDIEEKRLKSELGMANLERMKLIKRQDEHERAVNELEIEQQRLELQLIKETEQQKMELEKMRLEGDLEKERLASLANLTTEQLISVSDMNQAKILGDLAQSQTLRGMSAEEILAMKDPLALGKALEERARNSDSDELKNMYERMLVQMQQAQDTVVQAHRESADRAERMSSETVRAMSGQTQQLVDAERHSAERAERQADKAMEQMEGVASTQRSSGSSKKEGQAPGKKIQVCSKCKNEIAAGKNFCPNCGQQTY